MGYAGCIECASNSECTEQEGGVCGILHTCHYCNGDTPFWKVYKCVECLENSDCTQQDGGNCDILGRCNYPYSPELENEIPNSPTDSSDGGNSSENEIYITTPVNNSDGEDGNYIFVPTPVPSSGGGEGGIISENLETVDDEFYEEDDEKMIEGEHIKKPSYSSDGGIFYEKDSFNECNGCLLDDECHPFNNRQDGKYCSTNNNWTEQKFSDSFCENNFECKSNLCINSQCLSSGLWQRILNFFERIFR